MLTHSWVKIITRSRRAPAAPAGGLAGVPAGST